MPRRFRSVNEVKANLAQFQSVVPADVKIDYEFDQSSYVRNSLLSVVKEGLLGALLTGLMVLLFLRDWRSALIVVTTIPFALLAAVVVLWGAGQTINIMTLGGLALAVGILVDESTVCDGKHSQSSSGRARSCGCCLGSQQRSADSAPAGDALRVRRVCAVVLYGRCCPLSLCSSFASRGIRHGGFVPAIQLPCAGSLDVDSSGTSC